MIKTEGRIRLRAFVWNKKCLRLTALCLLLALLLSACSRQPAEPVTEPEETVQTVTAAPRAAGSVTLPYTSLASVNPYETSALLNAALIPLTCQSLYYLDAGFTPVPQLAAGETAAPDGVRVTLTEGAVFSDGSPLTAADVVYSFGRAKASPLYRTALANADACTADGNYTVQFTWKTADVNGLNLLTFPIVKQHTAEGADAFPVGSGPFVFRRDELRLSLQTNERYGGQKPQITAIRLYDITDASSLMHLLDTGGIDCFYTDLSEGTAKRSFSGTTEVYLNNLVFLGVNHNSYRLASADVRRALSLAVTRGGVCENAFLNHGRAAFYPVNTSWDRLVELQPDAEQTGDADLGAADALLASVGAGFTGDRLSYTLLCVDEGTFLPAAAGLLAEQLAGVNVAVDVQLVDRDAFEEALEKGKYDLYLSEIKLTKNMDLSPFFTPGGAAAWGMDLNALTVDEAYAQYRAGALELREFLDAFSASMPFIPLLFRNGQLCFSRSVTGGVEATEDNLFINIADWSV